MQPIPPTTKQFNKVGIHKLNLFPELSRQNKYIIICSDYCTKTVVAAATPDGTAEESAKFLLENVILQIGAPKMLITDVVHL